MPKASAASRVAAGDIPDIARILRDGAIGRKPTHSRGVEDTLAHPIPFAEPQSVDLTLSFKVFGEIGHHHVVIRVSQLVREGAES